MVKPERVGLDLDNTVIDYAPAYRSVADSIGLPPHLSDRTSIRSFLRRSDDDDEDWQRFQALLYTDGLASAAPAAGVVKFLAVCASMGIRVFIISHKTEATPGRFGARDLRTPAARWLERHAIVPDLVRDQDVHFCSTRAEKVRRIITTECQVFVDDLTEVLNDPSLPRDMSLFRYQPNAHSSESPVEEFAGIDFPGLSAWLREC